MKAKKVKNMKTRKERAILTKNWRLNLTSLSKMKTKRVTEMMKTKKVKKRTAKMRTMRTLKPRNC
jgi:hypothetical protein